MPNRCIRSFAAACALLLASCSTTRLSGNALIIPDETKGPNDLTLTITIGTKSTVTGMQVDTVGDDTVVTRLHDGTARRFILSGLTGYRGRLRFDSVDLIVGGTSIWIDEQRFKAHGPDGSIDEALAAPDGDDRFEGRDLILAGNELRAVGAQQ